MQQIGDKSQEILLKASQDTHDIVQKQGRKTPMPSDGSGTKAISVHGTRRPQPDEMRDILWKLSTIKPWQIRPEDQKAVKNALNVLGWTTFTATIDEAVYWLTRLIAHFPRRDASKDAVVVSDLSSDMIDAGVSLAALVAVCDDVRQGATKKDPWFPPSGEILLMAKKKTQSYADLKRRLETPYSKALPARSPAEHDLKPWSGKSFADMSDSVRLELYEFLSRYHSQTVMKIYCDCIGVEYQEVINWFNERKVDDA